MKKISIYILFLLFLALSGCKVSKDTEASAPELPDSYRNAVTTADTSAIANIDWKTFFPDPTLQELIGKAIAGNYDMQLAVKNIEASRLLLRQAKWGNVPQLNAYVTANSSIPSENSLNGLSANNFLGTSHVEDFNAGLSFSWEADIWGKISSRKKESLAQYLRTEEAAKAVQTEIVAVVAKSYYNLLMLDAQLDVAKRNLELSEKTLRMINMQFTAAQVTSLAVEQADAQRLAAARIVPMLEKEIIIQENALSVLMGEMPDEIARITTIDLEPVYSSIATGVPAEVLSRRPDIKSFEYDVMAANARVGITKAQMYPALNITASGGLNSFKSNNWFNMPQSLFGMVAGSLTQPLLNNRQLKTQYEVAKVEREKALIAFRQGVLIAVGEVSDALVRIEKLKEEGQHAEQRVTSLQRATGNADKLFNRGMANYLEVITAQGSVLQSELDLAALKRDQLNAVADLYRALGGGWE